MGEDAFELFNTDFNDSSIEVVVHAANKLTVVAAAIGGDRVNNELIPLLPKLIDYPSDEVLASIARQLFNIYDIAGASNIPGASLSIILSALQQLCEEEELIVRQSSVQSLNRIIPTLSNDDLVNRMLVIFKGLAGSEWFAPRSSAAGFASVLIKYISDNHRQSIINIYRSFLSDDTPMVKRVAALNFPAFLKSLFTSVNTELNMVEIVRMQLLFYVQQLALEERDYVRDLSPNLIATLVQYLTYDDYTKYLYPLLLGLADDHSWKVRQKLCYVCPTLVTSLIRKAEYIMHENDPYKTQDTITINDLSNTEHTMYLPKLLLQIWEIYTTLISDSNLEVRSIAILLASNMFYVMHGILDIPLREQKCTADITVEDNLNLDQQFQLPITSVLEHMKSSSSSSSSPTTTTKPSVKYTVSDSIQKLPLLSADQKNKVIQDLFEQLLLFSSDNTTLSKLDICEQIGELAPYLTSAQVTKYILPILSVLIYDDQFEVKATMFLSLHTIIELLDFEQIRTTIIPFIEHGQKDLRWRVRRAVTTQFSAIAAATKNHPEFHQNVLFPMIQISLLENVHTIRNRTAVEFRALTTILGYDVITAAFNNCFVTLFDQNINYIHRLTALHLVYFIATAGVIINGDDIIAAMGEHATTKDGKLQEPPRLPSIAIKTSVLTDYADIFIQSLSDPVPNVCILALRYIYKLFDAFEMNFFETKLLPCVHTLLTFSDKEVVYQARLVYEAYQNKNN